MLNSQFQEKIRTENKIVIPKIQESKLSRRFYRLRRIYP